MASTNAVPRLSLDDFVADRDLALLDRWLADPEVARWFVDPSHQKEEAISRGAHQQCLLSADGTPVGYKHLLVSIAQAFAVDVSSFGKGSDPAFTTGPLAGLT
jgi:hypothetical protein